MSAPLAIVLGAESLRFRRSGIGRVTVEIAEALRARDDVAALRLWMGGKWCDPSLLDTLDEVETDATPDAPAARSARVMRVRRLLGGLPGIRRWRDRVLLGRIAAAHDDLCARYEGRVVYHETNMVPFPFDGISVAQVNDLSWLHHPEMHPAARIDWIERNLKRLLTQPARFVAISQFTADGLVSELGVAADRIDVVPCAPSAAFRPVTDISEYGPVLARYGLEDRGYVLSISTLEPRKNFDRLAAAHASLPAALRRRIPLAIAGGTGWGETLAAPRVASARGEGSLRLLGHVPDAELAVLTARAACFAYVSLYEGFGLPLVEAMAAGAPVVASGTTATGETAGDAALLVDPLDVDAIRDALLRVIEDATLADALRARGFVRASSFSWARTAELLMGSWRSAIMETPARQK